MMRVLGFLSIMILCTISYGQGVKSFHHEGKVPTDENKLLVLADYYLEHGYFSASIDPLQKLVRLTGADEYKLKLADAYFSIHCYSKALSLYEELLDGDKQNDLFWYHLGIIYQGIEQYDQALIYLKKFVSDHNESYPEELKRANLAIRQCWSIANIKKMAAGAELRKLNIATPGHDIQSVATCGGQEIFSSQYTLKQPVEHKINDDLIVTIDSTTVYRLFIKEEGESRLLDIKVSKTANLISPFLSADCKRLYYTVCERIGDNDNCSIYYSKRLSEGWGNPIKLNSNVNQPNSSSKQAVVVSFSGKREVIFFSSNRSGGAGGYDLWMSEMDRQGRFSEAKNLQGINTPEDEVTPFFDSNTGHLFFSSSGRIGLGGFDVFMAEINWQQSVGSIYNLGKGINSGRDDYYFRLEDNSTAFITSNRSGCDNEVYKAHFSISFEYSKQPLSLTVVDEFRVKDSNLKRLDNYFRYSKRKKERSEITVLLEKNSEISGDILDEQIDLGSHRVLLIDDQGEVIDVAITDKNGFFQFRKLSENGDYAVVFSKEDEDLNLRLLVKGAQGDILRQYSSRDDENIFNYRELSNYITDFISFRKGDASLSGTLTLNKTPVSDHQVMLLNDQDEVVDAVSTNIQGEFNFRRLPSPGKYSVLLDEKDSGMNVELVIKDENGVELDKVSSITRAEVIKYRPLDPYKIAAFRLKVNDAKINSHLFEEGDKRGAKHERRLAQHEELRVAGGSSFLQHDSLSDSLLNRFTIGSSGEKQGLNLKEADLCGKFFMEDILKTAYQVILVADEGKTLDTTMIDTFGEFSFRNISIDSSYYLLIDDCMSSYDLKLEVVNKAQATVCCTSMVARSKVVYKAFERLESQAEEVNINETSEGLKVQHSDEFIDKWWLYSSIFLLLGGGVAYYLLRKRNS
ncbi:hypothetical protein [Fulvivirga sediminis]|uniref:Tetratricopeptide repeat protein n=1 Tax=Fulvivirga sediminis TaxID=2803949 RepID=A0A937F9A1_9BACT|nr:hypothetical protein [Fulvivirga sediminis]MBL3656644.1 hypothetical protein [Fulvivirga sediminis]